METNEPAVSEKSCQTGQTEGKEKTPAPSNCAEAKLLERVAVSKEKI